MSQVSKTPFKQKKSFSKEALDYIFSSHEQSYQFLVNKVYVLEGINQVFKTVVGEPLADHCTIANIREGTLVLEIDNGSWATRLRFETPDLLQLIRKQPGLESITDIEFYVKPSEKEAEGKTTPSITMSEHSATCLKQSASTIQDETLKEMLLNLAENGQ